MSNNSTISLEVQAFLKSLKSCEQLAGHDIVIFPSSPSYKEETKVWGAQRNLHPELVLRPTLPSQIPPLAKLLHDSPHPTLDFAIRNGSVGSTSAKHILVSLSALNSVAFDVESESVTVEAGALWRDVDSYMSREHPGWVVVGSRTPFVGVTGLVLVGGLSWLSHEFGMVSDPGNLLDVRIGLGDGREVWASEEAGGELLWGLRGGRCAFGIITQLKFRARRMDVERVFFGKVKYPMARLDEVSRRVSEHLETNRDPKLAFHATILNSKSPYVKSGPGIALILFDRHGSSHARSKDGFKWAFDIEDNQAETKEISLYEVNQQTDYAKTLMGTIYSFDATGLVDKVDDKLLVRARDWLDKVVESHEAFAAGSYCILETCQPPAFGSTRPEESAWPHGQPKHILQLGVGFSPEHSNLKSQALELLAEGFSTIPPSPLGRGDFTPTFLEPSLMDVKEMYGQNFEKLQKLAQTYDPKQKFRSLFKPDPNFA